MEEWRKVDSEGRYEVSNLGKVRSYVDFHGRIGATSHILKPHKGNNGYLMVMIYTKERNKNFLVHRLVAQAFIPNPNNYRCINHKDENKLNNCVSNLEWCTHRYNNNYNNKGKRISASLKNNSLITKPVYQLDKDGNIINEYKSITKAAEALGIKCAEISRVCLGHKYRHTAHGFGWKFK